MGVIERLREALHMGGKIRGHKVPVYGRGGEVDHLAIQHIELHAGEIAEVCAISDCPKARELEKGAKSVPPQTKVVIKADDLFEILDGVKEA